MCIMDVPMNKRTKKDHGIACKRCDGARIVYKRKGEHIGAYCYECERLIKWIDQRYISPLTDDSPCPVKGQHKNVLMKDLDASFLDWLHDQAWLEAKYPKVYDYIRINRKAIDMELQENA